MDAKSMTQAKVRASLRKYELVTFTKKRSQDSLDSAGLATKHIVKINKKRAIKKDIICPEYTTESTSNSKSYSKSKCKTHYDGAQ